jgi:diguanylate cyclase (GGDEF)-like protein
MLEAMEAGAWDFATQPFDGPLLLARIRTYLSAKAAYDHALAEATIDVETGAYNRRGLTQRLSELWSDARRRREPVTCLVISAQVPEIESALEQAQAVAASVARAIRSAVRGSDPVARLSPLEFAVMAPNLDHDAALHLLDRVQRQLSGRTGGKLPVRTGVTTIEPSDGVTIEQALDRASHAVDWSAGARFLVVNE